MPALQKAFLENPIIRTALTLAAFDSVAARVSALRAITYQSSGADVAAAINYVDALITQFAATIAAAVRNALKRLSTNQVELMLVGGWNKLEATICEAVMNAGGTPLLLAFPHAPLQGSFGAAERGRYAALDNYAGCRPHQKELRR